MRYIIIFLITMVYGCSSTPNYNCPLMCVMKHKDVMTKDKTEVIVEYCNFICEENGHFFEWYR